jgi:hypothetical protein
LRNETLHWNADKVTRLQNRLQARRTLSAQPILLALDSAPPPLHLPTGTSSIVTTDPAQAKKSIHVDAIIKGQPTGGSTEIGEIGEKDGKFEVIIKDTLAALVTKFITSLTTSINIDSQAEVNADVTSNATAGADTQTIANATAGTLVIEPSALLEDKMDANACITTEKKTDAKISTADSALTEETDPDGDSEDDNEWIFL